MIFEDLKFFSGNVTVLENGLLHSDSPCLIRKTYDCLFICDEFIQKVIRLDNGNSIDIDNESCIGYYINK